MQWGQSWTCVVVRVIANNRLRLLAFEFRLIHDAYISRQLNNRRPSKGATTSGHRRQFNLSMYACVTFHDFLRRVILLCFTVGRRRKSFRVCLGTYFFNGFSFSQGKLVYFLLGKYESLEKMMFPN